MSIGYWTRMSQFQKLLSNPPAKKVLSVIQIIEDDSEVAELKRTATDAGEEFEIVAEDEE